MRKVIPLLLLFSLVLVVPVMATNFTWYQINGATTNNDTAAVAAIDNSPSNAPTDWNTKYTKIVADTGQYFYDGDKLNMWSKSSVNNKTYYIHDVTGNITYATFTTHPNSGNYMWSNVTLANIGTTETTLYISDLNAAGSSNFYTDYAEIILMQPATNLGLYLDTYFVNQQANILMSSSAVSTNHTLKLYNASGTVFCDKNITSPSVAYTQFSTQCTMPANTQTGTAIFYEIGNIKENITNSFTVSDPQKNAAKLDISKIYYSAQVLQGGSVEIFAVIETAVNITIDSLYTMVTFPDNTTRKFAMEPTINTGEYKTFITDTYQTGNVSFEIVVRSGGYYDSYTNKYRVMEYYISSVGSVGVVDSVKKLQQAAINVFGTEYTPGDSGTVFVQVIEAGDLPVNNASCYLTIFKPDNSLLYHDTLMSYQNESNGIYYWDFSVPSTLGVYMTDVYCEYATAEEYDYATSYQLNKGWYVSGTGASLTTLDTDRLYLRERNYAIPSTASGSVILMDRLDSATGTTAYDDSTNQHTGTHYGGVLLDQTGLLGTSAYYDGVNDYTHFTKISAYDFTNTEELMVCFGLKHGITGDANGDFILDGMGTGTEGWRFTWEGGSQIRLTTDRSGTAAQSIQTATAYNDNVWHTICGYASFTTMTIYVDGVSVSSTARTQSGTITNTGGYYWSQDGANAKWGTQYLDEVCVIKGTITAATIATNYHSTKTCGSAGFSLETNVTIVNVTPAMQLNDYSIETTYQWDDPGVENINVYLYNVTGDSWYKLSNSLAYSLTDTSVASNLINSNINISQFISGTSMKVKYNDSVPDGATFGNFKINQVKLTQVNFVETPITTIRGGGEVHVTNIPAAVTQVSGSVIAPYVWNYTNRTTTEVAAPVYSLTVQGTDYQVGDNSRVFLQLTKDKQPLDGQYCQATIHYPDSSKASPHYYVKDAFMVGMGIDGLYYLDFTAPSDIGIYMVSAVCYTGANTTILYAVNETLIEGSVQSGTLANTYLGDSSYYILKEQDNGGGNRSYIHDFWFNASGLPNVTNFTQTVAAIIVAGKLVPLNAEYLSISAYNWSSGSFVEFPYYWYSQALGSADAVITNGPETAGGGDFINQTSSMIRVRIEDKLRTGDTNSNEIRINQLLIGRTEKIAETVTVAGGGELNVRQSNLTAESIWAYSNRTLTQNITVAVDLSSVLSYLSQNQVYLLQLLTDTQHIQEFSEESIYLITDAITEMQMTDKEVKAGILSEDEGKERISKTVGELLNNPIFYNPNEIYITATKDSCNSYIKNEGKNPGYYQVDLSVGPRKETKFVSLAPQESTIISISLVDLPAGKYECTTISNYGSWNSRASVQIYYNPKTGAELIKQSTVVLLESNIQQSQYSFKWFYFFIACSLVAYLMAQGDIKISNRREKHDQK